MDKRIIEETPSTEVLNDDWLIKDSPTGGTSKILGSKLKEIISGDVEDSIDKILDSIAPEWSSTFSYGYDAYVIYEGKLWRCFKDTGSTVGEFKTSEWIKGVTSGYITHVIDKIADRFVASDPPFMTYRYSVGDMVFYSEPYHDEQLYVCNTDLPQGESTFNPEHWDVVYTVAGLSKYLMDKIAEAGQIDDVQVKTTGDYESVVDENKVAKIDLSNVLIEKSVPNLPQPIASFSDGADAVMQSLKVDIEPVQSGSGDPSPTNVRPISGWSGCEVGVAGKNFSGELEIGSFADSSQIGSTYDEMKIVISTRIRSKWLIPTFNNNIVISCDFANYQYCFCLYDENKKYLGQVDGFGSWKSVPYTPVTPSGYVAIVLKRNDGATITSDDLENCHLQVELGTTATTYEPYAGTTTTIPFTDSQGNPVEVYGGTLDVTSGVLTVDRVNLLLNGLTYTMNPRVTSVGGSYFRAVIPQKAISDTDNAQLYSHGISNNAYSSKTNCARAFESTPWVFVGFTDEMGIDTLEKFNQWLADNPSASICYKIKDPQTYQLTPTQVKSLLGSNNVFASTGDVTKLEYIANATDVIANLEARVTALENA